MVITVTCPSCSSSFPVDPAKIPERGVNVRCTECAEIFRVERPREQAPEPVMELPELTPVESASPAHAEAPAASSREWVVEHDEPETPQLAPEFQRRPDGQDPFGQAAPFEQRARFAEEPTPPPLPDQAEPAAEPSVQAFTFGKRDPTDKAKRLARVLVSDMIMYNAERHQSALAAGTLVQDFEDEIEKSWKEFVEQVGDDLANGPGRGFWKEALNDILAKGEKVF